MKIAFNLGRLLGSDYYRLLVPARALKRRGHDIRYVKSPFDNALVDMKPLGPMNGKVFLETVDAFVCARVGNSDQIIPRFDYLRKVHRMSFVHDLDDNYNVTNPAVESYRRGSETSRSIDKMNAFVDVLSLATPGLIEEYAKQQRQISINYNAIEDDEFERWYAREIDGQPKVQGEIRIGWAGSFYRNHDMVHMVRPIRAILEEFPQTKLVIVGGDVREAFAGRCGCHQSRAFGFQACAQHRGRIIYGGRSKTLQEMYNLTDDQLLAQTYHDHPELPSLQYYRLLHQAQIDIGFVATAGSLFTKGKSYLKLMEYGMFGIPAMAPSYGPYRQYTDESPDMDVALLYNDEHSAYNHLRRLVVDTDLRAKLAANNLRYVGEKHLISHKVETWEKTLLWACGYLKPPSSSESSASALSEGPSQLAPVIPFNRVQRRQLQRTHL